MSKPILYSSDRVIRLQASLIAAAPANNTDPHMLQAPLVEGLPTRGFGLALVAPDSASPNAAAIANAGGFTITVHRLIPTLGVYAAGVSKAGISFKQQFVNFDMGGSQAYFFVVDALTVNTDGDILFCFTELP